MGLLVDRHPHLVAPRRQRLDPRSSRFRDMRRAPRGVRAARRQRHRLRLGHRLRLRHQPGLRHPLGPRRVLGRHGARPARQRHHPRRKIRSGRNLRHQLLDRPLAQVPRPRQDFGVVLLGEVRREEVQPAQVDLAVRDHRERQREPPRRPRRRDPLPRRTLRHVQPLDAVRKQGSGRLAQVQPPPVHLCQIRQKLRRQLVRSRDQPLHSLEHPIIGHRFKTSSFHPPPLARAPRAPRERAHSLSLRRSPSARALSPSTSQTPATGKLRPSSRRSRTATPSAQPDLSTLGLPLSP